MPLPRLDKQFYAFFNSQRNPVSAAGTSESYYNSGYSSMTIEVSGTDNINAHVEGCLSIENPDGTNKTDEQCSWTQLKLIDLSTLDQVNAMEAKGLYLLALCGCQRIRVVIDSIEGSATILSILGD